MMLSVDDKIKMLHDMLLIRALEERIDAEYPQDQMCTPVHLCIGQEAIAVGACYALKKDDFISSNHRSHGHYLAKGGDLRALVAELFCRSTGCSKGFGGSMHVIDTAVGHLGSSSIVGGGIPIGTGHALAFRMRGEDRVSLVFLGDGASEEGVFYESVNFAVLNNLPVIYVLENNGWAVCSPTSRREKYPSVFHTGYPHEALSAFTIDGNDVNAVFETVSYAVARARRGDGPTFIECRTYRVSPHVGCASQDPRGYRYKEEIEYWRARCPIDQYRNKLLGDGVLFKSDLLVIEDAVRKEISDSFAYALQSPRPTAQEAAGCVYC